VDQRYTGAEYRFREGHILWKFCGGGTKAVQLKSSQNPFRKGDIQRWAQELEEWKEADQYELVLVGRHASPAAAKIKTVGKVAVPPPKNLDLRAFQEQAAHRLDRFLRDHRLPQGDSDYREMLAGALTEKLTTGSPWILFYFGKTEIDPDELDFEQYSKVRKFREALERKSQGLYATYRGVRGSEDGFYEQVSQHLRDIVHRLAPSRPGVKPSPPPTDPTKYLRDLQDKTTHIDIRGLQVGTGRANRFPIEELYISLTTTGPSKRMEMDKAKAGKRKRRDEDRESELSFAEQREVPLHEVLTSDRLVVIGDPGAGKTTFLRRIAYALSQTHLGDVPKAAEERLGIKDRTFPVFVRIGELAQHLLRDAHETVPPTGDHTPAWLPHYLGAVGKSCSWGLDAGFFRQQLEGGRCTVLLDGLDEAPDRVMRERLSRLIENVTKTYSNCRFVVTSRPVAYIGEVVLPDFAHARIDPLSDQAVETFLSRWCEAVYSESQRAAETHRDELLSAVQARVEIRRMARNPVMLTALAVVHWNERRLPEQRADLYDSVITWLSRSREQRPGRATADQTVVLLQELALAMQDDPKGRKTQVPKRWAAEKLAGEVGSGKLSRDTIKQAEQFLDEEEVDSGIVVGRGNEVTYWHLTFQEFLAAKAINSQPEAEQTKILFSDPGKIYLPDWRETLLLLSGVLHEQGKAKVDWLIGNVLNALSQSPDLAAQARCSGLIGNILRDLEPVKYNVSDARYHKLLQRVMAVFDRKRFQDVPVEERIAAADALGQAGDPRIDFARDEYWATITAGDFLMGAQSKDKRKPNYDKEANDDLEAPVHRVHLDPYRIARYPVTVGQYKPFVEEEGYKEKRWWQVGGFGEFSEPEDWERQVEFPSRPVVGVSWWEAAAYCRWAGHRLPTESEWERAARGTEAREYPWGKEEPDENRMNFNSKVGHATPVGIFPLDVTAEGISDMGGNVLEWCADWYGKYTDESVSNPRGPRQATFRVIRGGSWRFVSRYCRAAIRGRREPRSRSDFLGFRVAAVPSSQSSQEQASKKQTQVNRQAEPGA